VSVYSNRHIRPSVGKYDTLKKNSRIVMKFGTGEQH